MPKRLTITVLAVLMCAFAEAHATEPVSKEAEFKDRMDKLDPRNSQNDKLLDRLGPGAELHVSSVWDLKNVKGEIVLGK